MTESFQAFIKAVPDIIKAAGQSESALFALMVLCLGVLTIYLWRSGVSAGVRSAVFVLLFSGVFAYGWTLSRLSAPYEVFGHVTDRATSKSVSGAEIRFSDASIANSLRTDCNGLIRFWTRTKPEALKGSVTVEHPDYESLTTSLSPENLMFLALQPKGRNPPAVGAPAASTPSAPPSLPERRIVETSSGPQLSGRGAGWSGWYPLQSGAAPDGYTFDHEEFWLTGDRQCGAWSECQRLQANDAAVSYRFRLQGHNEWPPPGQGLSEGHLRVTYKRKG